MRCDLHSHRFFDGEKTGGIWLMSVETGRGHQPMLFHPDSLRPRLSMLILGAAGVLGGMLFTSTPTAGCPRFDRRLSRAGCLRRD